MWTGLGELIKRAVADQWILKGHSLTGNYERSLEWEVTQEGDKIIGTLWGNHYGPIMNRGVRPERIPYSRGSGAGTSKYITGLINYVQLRMGIGGKEGRSIAFAIANKHKQKGILGSEFLDIAIRDSQREIDEEVSKLINKLIDGEK